jgi:ADP-L-glycero-D-manno-heptose 6-epimerase
MDYLYANNFRFSKDLLEYSFENKIRFIYASSAAVYGDGKLGFSDKDDITAKLKPLNKYGYSKWLFDNYVLKGGFKDFACGLRFFNVFGPNEYHKKEMSSVVYKAFNQVQETGMLKLFKSHLPGYKDGEQKRDFIYVKDICEILWFFLNNYKGGIYNAGTGKAGSFNLLADAVFKSLGNDFKTEYIDMPENVVTQYQYFTEADISKLRNAGYDKDFTPLLEGVEDYIKNYLNRNNLYM